MRYSKTLDGIKTTHVWDGLSIVLDISDNNRVKGIYLRGSSLCARIQDNSTHYYLHNAHGDVVYLTDENTNLLKYYDYSAFGIENKAEKNDSNPFRYCGEYYDKEIKNIYLRARYYDPAVGRFTSEDPIGDGQNWYAYCNNNPINRVDPSGLDSYVIYSYYDENKVAARAIAKQLKEKYGTKTHIINIQSASEFEATWNNLGTKSDIDAISFISHGHTYYDQSDNAPADLGESTIKGFGIGFIQFRDEALYKNSETRDRSTTLLFANSYNGMSSSNRSVSDLSSIAAKELNFLSCNTANPDFKSNIMQAFFDKNSLISSVSGYDGGMFIYDGRKWWKRGTEFASAETMERNATFLKFRKIGDSPNREKQDKVTLTREPTINSSGNGNRVHGGGSRSF